MMLLLARDAWVAALCEDGPGEVADVCSALYGACADFIDLADVRAAVAAGKGPEIIRSLRSLEPPGDIMTSMQQIIDVLCPPKHEA